MMIVGKLRGVAHHYREGGLRQVGSAAIKAIEWLLGIHPNYAVWVRRYDTLGAADLEHMRGQLSAFESRPLISILMPVYNAPDGILVAAIESVRSQVYPNWELCIADDASTLPHIRSTLERFQRADPRIKVKFREVHGRISKASNMALEMARGDWVALLDPDDMLRPHSLFAAVATLNRYPQAKLVYSDEDKLDDRNRRCEPYFKPDWNYEMFLSHDLVAHFAMFRMDLVRKAGGFRVGYEGAQDYDLTLRIVEHCGEDEIIHIPRILYHRRKSPESNVRSRDAKSYAMAAGERALNEHLQRTKKNARAHTVGMRYRVDYEVPHPEPLVSILIPTKDRLDLLSKCIESIRQNTDYENWEICIVDNNSVEQQTMNWFDEIQRDPRIRVLRDTGDFNYSRINNLAVRATSGEFILLLNNDIEVMTPGWLRELVAVCSQPGVGAVGARLWYPNRTLQHGGVIMGMGGIASHSHQGLSMGQTGYMGRVAVRQELSAVTGACMLTRREAYEAVGGLDEECLKVAYNDIDYCLKLRSLGWRIVWTPFADLYHHESASRGSDSSLERKARFDGEQAVMRSRWKKWMDHDPAYNPNLSLGDTMFNLAFAPRGTSLPAIVPASDT